MRIGLPNILPLYGFLFFGTVSVSMTILFFDKAAVTEPGAAIFFVILLILSFGMFGLLSFRLKIVAMTNSKLVIIFPFRLKFKTFTYQEISNLKWDLWQTFKFGDYRKLNIQTTSGFRANISDLEFINYDSLEKWLVERTKLDLNLDRKIYVEVQQARYNKWVNIVVILVVGFFAFVTATDGNDSNVRAVILGLFAVLLWRLSVRLVQYQQRINESRQRRENWKSKTSR